MTEPKIEAYNIKYIPTGNIFLLPKEECDRLMQSEPFNFQVVDENYKKPELEEKSSIMQQVIIEDNANAEGNTGDKPENPYKKLKNKDAVIALLKERNLEFDPTATRPELEAVLIANDNANAEGN